MCGEVLLAELAPRLRGREALLAHVWNDPTASSMVPEVGVPNAAPPLLPNVPRPSPHGAVSRPRALSCQPRALCHSGASRRIQSRHQTTVHVTSRVKRHLVGVGGAPRGGERGWRRTGTDTFSVGRFLRLRVPVPDPGPASPGGWVAVAGLPLACRGHTLYARAVPSARSLCSVAVAAQSHCVVYM